MQVRLTSIVRVLKRDLGTLKRELNELNAHSNIHNIRFFCEYSKKNHINRKFFETTELYLFPCNFMKIDWYKEQLEIY